jgi:c-di-GMP-related signal transduction protein
MSAAVQSIPNSGDSAFTATHRLASVVRQPILDSFGRVHAYELRFRGEPDPDAVGASMNLFETAASFGLEKASELKKLTGKLTAFLRCPMEALSEQLAQVLPASLTVLEICPSSKVSPEVLAICRQMKALGFRFALDDVRAEPQTRSLLEMTDYIKVDFGGTTSEEFRELLKQLCSGSFMLLAKGVNTQEDYRNARDEGLTLFEGYYFCEPVAIRNRRPPVNQMLRLDILKALQKNTMDMHKVSQLVMRDGPIAYQLLRLVNSPVWGMRQKVESIEMALVAVGENSFRRIATLAIAAEFNGDQPPELLCMAMLRGHICEVMASKRGLDPFGQYLLGLFSLLPAMQGQSMSEVTRTLPLSDEILLALMGKLNPERVLLSWLENCERGDWAGCDAAAQANELDQAELSKVYVEGVAWTEAALHMAD